MLYAYVFPGSFLSLPGREVGKGFPIGISRWIVQIVPGHTYTHFSFSWQKPMGPNSSSNGNWAAQFRGTDTKIKKKKKKKKGRTICDVRPSEEKKRKERTRQSEGI